MQAFLLRQDKMWDVGRASVAGGKAERAAGAAGFSSPAEFPFGSLKNVDKGLFLKKGLSHLMVSLIFVYEKKKTDIGHRDDEKMLLALAADAAALAFAGR